MLKVGDRYYAVIYEGLILGTFDVDKADINTIGLLMTGGTGGRPLPNPPASDASSGPDR